MSALVRIGAWAAIIGLCLFGGIVLRVGGAASLTVGLLRSVRSLGASDTGYSPYAITTTAHHYGVAGSWASGWGVRSGWLRARRATLWRSVRRCGRWLTQGTGFVARRGDEPVEVGFEQPLQGELLDAQRSYAPPRGLTAVTTIKLAS
jgi:hypothetical protein